MVVIAAETLDYDAGFWYNDDAHDAYQAVYPNGTRYWVPARNYTPCSGFAECAEQTAFNGKTPHPLHLIVTHRYNKTRRLARAKEMANGMVYGMIDGTEDKAYYARAIQPLFTPLKQWHGGPGKGQGPLYGYTQCFVKSQSYYMLPRYG